MTHKNPNARLEAFSDGVFAIAITLLIIEIKVPKVENIHSVSDMWHAITHLWPSFFALVLSFMVILIAWVNHHGIFEELDKTSPHFMYANGFFLLTIVVLPFPSALLGEYIQTDYAQPAIFLFNMACLLNSIGWNIMWMAIEKPKLLAKNSESHQFLKDGKKYTIFGFFINLAVVIFGWWFPLTSICINTVLWFFWLIIGMTYKKQVEGV